MAYIVGHKTEAGAQRYVNYLERASADGGRVGQVLEDRRVVNAPVGGTRGGYTGQFACRFGTKYSSDKEYVYIYNSSDPQSQYAGFWRDAHGVVRTVSCSSYKIPSEKGVYFMCITIRWWGSFGDWASASFSIAKPDEIVFKTGFYTEILAVINVEEIEPEEGSDNQEKVLQPTIKQVWKYGSLSFFDNFSRLSYYFDAKKLDKNTLEVTSAIKSVVLYDKEHNERVSAPVDFSSLKIPLIPNSMRLGIYLLIEYPESGLFRDAETSTGAVKSHVFITEVWNTSVKEGNRYTLYPIAFVSLTSRTIDDVTYTFPSLEIVSYAVDYTASAYYMIAEAASFRGDKQQFQCTGLWDISITPTESYINVTETAKGIRCYGGTLYMNGSSAGQIPLTDLPVADKSGYINLYRKYDPVTYAVTCGVDFAANIPQEERTWQRNLIYYSKGNKGRNIVSGFNPTAYEVEGRWLIRL